MSQQNFKKENPLSQNPSQFMANILQQDPNPIIIITPIGKIVFANEKGKIILEHWQDDLPESILKTANSTQVSNEIMRLEMNVMHKIYLFNLVWIPEFQQINIYGIDISQLK